MFDQSTCSSVPTCHAPWPPRASPVKFASLRGGAGAKRSPSFRGEHGEDPQYDRAEHGATLTQKGAHKPPAHAMSGTPVRHPRASKTQTPDRATRHLPSAPGDRLPARPRRLFCSAAARQPQTPPPSPPISTANCSRKTCNPPSPRSSPAQTGPTEITDLPANATQQAETALATALAIYPPGFIDKRVTRLALAGQITLWNTQVGGFFATDTIALNAHDVSTPGGETFFADSFHHELSSIIRNEILFNVSEWTAANPPNFTYASMQDYKKILTQRPSVEGDATLHAQGFVSLYGTTSLDNDWNTYAERVFGHAREHAALIEQFPKMREKTRQLLDIYGKLDPRLEQYFTTTGLRGAVRQGQGALPPAPPLRTSP